MTSGHEHAAIYATVAGVITRGDLRGKRGPKTLNYLPDGKVIDAAVAAAEGTIGKITVVQRVLIYDTSLSIDALVRVRRITSAANADINSVLHLADVAGVRPVLPRSAAACAFSAR